MNEDQPNAPGTLGADQWDGMFRPDVDLHAPGAALAALAQQGDLFAPKKTIQWLTVKTRQARIVGGRHVPASVEVGHGDLTLKVEYGWQSPRRRSRAEALELLQQEALSKLGCLSLVDPPKKYV